MIGQGEVLHGKGKAARRIAFDFGAVAERVWGTGDFIGIAARIGAFAAIAAATQGLRREQTQAAVGVAKGAVDEDFRFDAGCLRDVMDFFESQFSRQDHAAKAEVLENFRAGPVVDRHLRAAVQFQLREVLANRPGRRPGLEG